MKIRAFFFMVPGIVLCLSISTQAQTDKVEYVPRLKRPVLEEIENRADSLQAIRDSITDDIRNRQDSLAKMKEDDRKRIRFAFDSIVKPASPDIFAASFHFPPVPQYLTGTCWCFAGTSFLESEICRVTGQEIRLSEMYTVYYEYVEKARYFVHRRGDYDMGEGAETGEVPRIITLHGAVPLDAYPGQVDGEKYDHTALYHEIRHYLAYVKDHNLWDENMVIGQVKVILNKYIGDPPETFMYAGRLMTPRLFADQVMGVEPGEYISVISSLTAPFHAQAEFESPDNWWHDSAYYNLPLDEWYAVVVNAVDSGYTVAITGDVSEPGWNGLEDAAVIPDFDIPQDHINQDSREYRIANYATTDDHCVHIVGHTVVDGRDWFLVKDSGSSSRLGRFPGYYFMRDDYLRLKMLTFTVHRDMIESLLDKMTPVGEG